HYYYAGFSFYNYPYAFGLLFGTGLYAIYQQRGAEFTKDYRDLLASTGLGDAATLAQRFGINIREKKFWQDSLAVIGEQIEEYVNLMAQPGMQQLQKSPPNWRAFFMGRVDAEWCW